MTSVAPARCAPTPRVWDQACLSRFVAGLGQPLRALGRHVVRSRPRGARVPLCGQARPPRRVCCDETTVCGGVAACVRCLEATTAPRGVNRAAAAAVGVGGRAVHGHRWHICRGAARRRVRGARCAYAFRVWAPIRPMHFAYGRPLLLPLVLLLVGPSGAAERDFYEVLGVARGAGDADIKRAYRALSLQVNAPVCCVCHLLCVWGVCVPFCALALLCLPCPGDNLDVSETHRVMMSHARECGSLRTFAVPP